MKFYACFALCCMYLHGSDSLLLQLYVSVDAATKDSMKAIDRPLFGDFWERFVVCAISWLSSIPIYAKTLVLTWF